jgi:hypothetical protein
MRTLLHSAILLTALLAGCYETSGFDTDGGADTATSTDVPDGWACAGAYYGTGDGCDCGCAMDDPDCDGLGCADPGCTADGCDWCWDGPGTMTGCTPAPDGWTCAGGFYGTGDGCDCGCGIDDPDCNGGGCTEPGCTDDACQYCFDEGGVMSGCAPEGWSCPDAYYGDTYCDCGCGIDDPDCAGAGCAEPECWEPACQFCFDATGTMITCTDDADAGTVADAG